MRAALDDPAAVDDEDHVGGDDRREPVGDRDRRAALHQRLERALDEPLARGVERRRRLVEHEDARVLEQHACDREPLLLAARHAVAALAHPRVVPVLELENPVVDERGRGGALDLGVGRVGLRVEQVLAHGRVEEVRLLGHHPDRLGERAERDLLHVGPVDRDDALGRLVEARDQVRDGRLAGAARADERGELAGLDLEVDVLERPAAGRAEVPVDVRPRLAVVREGHVPEGHLAAEVVLRDLPARRAGRRSRAAGRGTGRSARTARARTGSRSTPGAWSRSGRRAASGAP